MSAKEILELINYILYIFIGAVAIITFLTWWVIKVNQFRLKKNKIKNTIFKEELNNNWPDDNFKEQLQKYFKNLNGIVNMQLITNFFKIEIEKKQNKTKIAWNFFVLITTSVLANDSKGLVSEAVDSIYKTFQKTKKLLLETEESSILTDFILVILNLKIRPILTKSRRLARFNENKTELKIYDDELSESEKDEFWKEISDLRTDLIENKYLRLISLVSLSTQTNKDIMNLLNYQQINKATKEEEYLDQGIAKIINLKKEMQ